MASVLAPLDQERLTWWTRGDGSLAAQLVQRVELQFQFSATAIVRKPDGSIRPQQPPVEPDWHPSFRYFRLGQTATDVVDAFRNYYLALESLLSAVVPVKVRQNGRPDEGEGAWLARALADLGGRVDLSEFAEDQAASDLVDNLKSDLYHGARTGTFHSKDGQFVLLPHDSATREGLRSRVARLRRLYIEAVRTYLNVQFAGPGGLSPDGFRAMTGGFNLRSLHFAEALDEPVVGMDVGLSDAVVLPGLDVAVRPIDEYTISFTASVNPEVGGLSRFRYLGWSRDDGVLATYGDVEGNLDVTGLTSVEVVTVIATPDPRALGVRYLS